MAHSLGPGNLLRLTPDADPRHVYHNLGIAIDSSRDLFNGQPTVVGSWIHALALQAGNHVLHVGCGLGYYSALMAQMVGAGGRVVAIDVDESLQARRGPTSPQRAGARRVMAPA